MLLITRARANSLKYLHYHQFQCKFRERKIPEREEKKRNNLSANWSMKKFLRYHRREPCPLADKSLYNSTI